MQQVKNQAPASSAAQNQYDEVVQPATEKQIPTATVALCEPVAQRNRCGQVCYSYQQRSYQIGNDGGVLVVMGADGKIAQPLDLKRLGAQHLCMHQGRLFDAVSGKEITPKYAIRPEQVAGKPFFNFRGHDGVQYFVTEGLPSGKTIEVKHTYQNIQVRDANGCCVVQRRYSATRELVEIGKVQHTRTYSLSENGSKLAGYTAVQQGVKHSQYGTERFVFNHDTQAMIKVFERKDSSGQSIWTFARRNDRDYFITDCNGCGRRETRTEWVADPNLKIGSPKKKGETSGGISPALPKGNLYEEDPVIDPQRQVTPRPRLAPTPITPGEDPFSSPGPSMELPDPFAPLKTTPEARIPIVAPRVNGPIT